MITSLEVGHFAGLSALNSLYAFEGRIHVSWLYLNFSFISCFSFTCWVPSNLLTYFLFSSPAVCFTFFYVSFCFYFLYISSPSSLILFRFSPFHIHIHTHTHIHTLSLSLFSLRFSRFFSRTLSNNLFSILPNNVFSPLVSLSTLTIASNYLTYIGPNAFAGLSQLSSLCDICFTIVYIINHLFLGLFTLIGIHTLTHSCRLFLYFCLLFSVVCTSFLSLSLSLCLFNQSIFSLYLVLIVRSIENGISQSPFSSLSNNIFSPLTALQFL